LTNSPLLPPFIHNQFQNYVEPPITTFSQSTDWIYYNQLQCLYRTRFYCYFSHSITVQYSSYTADNIWREMTLYDGEMGNVW